MNAANSGLDPRIEAIASHIGRRLADAAVEDMRARYDFGRADPGAVIGRDVARTAASLRKLSPPAASRGRAPCASSRVGSPWTPAPSAASPR